MRVGVGVGVGVGVKVRIRVGHLERRAAQRQPEHSTQMLLVLVGEGGVHGVVARVVRPRCDLVELVRARVRVGGGVMARIQVRVRVRVRAIG